MMSLFPIGLTGGMGSGKSTVSRILQSHGFDIIDADQISRLTCRMPETAQQLMAAFGQDLYDAPRGIPELDRPLLARRAFASDNSRQMLNDIMHPAMKKTAVQMLNAAQNPAILDAPLLFEAGWDALVKTTIAVLCPLETRIQRIVQRDHLEPDQIMARIRAQIDDYEKRADILFYNTGDPDALRQQVTKWLRIISN